MDDAISRSLAEWNGYYALMGGAAATLLGLLFVAVSLRLNIFRQRNVADIREFAVFTLATFMAALVIAALALAPHASRMVVSLVTLLMAIVGLALSVVVLKTWRQLESPEEKALPGLSPAERQILLYGAGTSGPYLGLLVVALLLWRESPAALGLLALLEVWLLIAGTLATWLLLSHAGQDAGGSE
jgi:FlaA1/EpsC-like NDP-sugar epimerase